MRELAKAWNDYARSKHLKYLLNKLKKEGVFYCPRYFILRYFDKNDFEYLVQNKNKTSYKLKISKTP